jgi:hypothetical protein
MLVKRTSSGAGRLSTDGIQQGLFAKAPTCTKPTGLLEYDSSTDRCWEIAWRVSPSPRFIASRAQACALDG